MNKKDNNLLVKFLRLLFVRSANTNDLKNYKNWRVGLSSAASWSWGVSLAVGIAIMYSKGLLPFMIWTSGNILALPLFGLVRKYLPLSKYGPHFIFPMVILFFFVEFFCIILNLQGLLNGFIGEIKAEGEVIKLFSHSFLSGDAATYTVIAIGFFIVWYINKGGLKISVLTDMGQYLVQLTAVVLMAVLGLFLGEQNDVQWIVVNGTVDGLEWAKFGFFGIIVGALGTSHQWQRFSAIKEENILPSSLWGGLFFGIYMLFVGLAGYNFTPHIILGLLFLTTMIALASSSIDSAVAGLEYVVEKLTSGKLNDTSSFVKPHYVSTVVALIAIIMWPFFIKLGITRIWSFMAFYRLPVVAFFILGTYFATVVITIVKNNKIK